MGFAENAYQVDNIGHLTAKDIMTQNPKKIDNDAMAVKH